MVRSFINTMRKATLLVWNIDVLNGDPIKSCAASAKAETTPTGFQLQGGEGGPGFTPP